MKILILALAAATLGLAVASAYLMNQIEIERRRTQIEAEQRLELQARLNQLERNRPTVASSKADSEPGDSSQSAAAAQPIAGVSGNTTSRQDATGNAGDEQRARRNSQRKMLEDPGSRDLLRARKRAETRASNPELASELQLTEEEHDRLLDLLAEQALQVMERYTQNDSVSDSVVKEVGDLRVKHRREIADLLGDEKARQYEEYRASGPVRAQVRQFRGRLDEANVLSDGQAARLIAVLQEERERFTKELREQHANDHVTMTMGTWDGGSFMASDSVSASAQEQILKQMEAYSRRMVHGAASVLVAGQLRVFEEIQDERLAHQRADLMIEAGSERK